MDARRLRGALRCLLPLLLAVAGSVPVVGEAQQPGGLLTIQDGEIRVSATASLDTAPDRAWIRLTVQQDGATAAAASASVAKQVAALRAAWGPVVPGGLERVLQTVSYGVQPRLSWQPTTGTSRVIGYRASHTVALRLEDLALVGRLIDAGLAVAGSQLDGVRYELRAPTLVRDRLLTEAMQTARQQAEVLARAAGRQLGGLAQVEVIDDGSGPLPTPMPRMMAMAVADAAPPTELAPTTQTVQVRIQTRWRLAP